MGKLISSPILIKKLLFMQKYADKVLVAPKTISSSQILICFPELSDTTFGIKVKDLLELAKHSSEFEIKNKRLSYSYKIGGITIFNDNEAGSTADGQITNNAAIKGSIEDNENSNNGICKIIKYADLFDLKYNFNFVNPAVTLKLLDFNVISANDTDLVFKENKIILQTSGHISTRLVFDVAKIDGIDYFKVKVRGNELKIICELEGDKALCYHGNFLVAYGFENDVTTFLILKIL